jgi:hypothetical protein
LTTDQALAVIDQLADAGVMVLAFSGGEPMLRRDWAVLVRRAVGRGLSVNVGTNGSAVTERRADQPGNDQTNCPGPGTTGRTRLRDRAGVASHWITRVRHRAGRRTATAVRQESAAG